MLKNHKITEEEKIENKENIPYHNITSNRNYNLNINNQTEINNDNENNNYNYISNSSNKALINDKRNFNKESINIDSNLNFNQKTIENNNTFKEIKIINKLTKTDNKTPNNNLKVVTINKEDLYNAFILFQQLISKYDINNENNIEYIKNRLFEFVSMKRNNFFNETIECNDNFDDNENENILDIQNYMQIYCKTEKGINLNNINNNENNNMNLIRINSFSYDVNDKIKIFNNYFSTLLHDAKETIRSNSQIFNEYLLIDRKFKDKTISEENSKSFHHNYSFDIKNKEKNELSFHSIEKNKEKEKDEYLIIENNDIYNNYNFSSYKKELKHTSPFNAGGFSLLGNDFRKYSIEGDLNKPLFQKNKSLKVSLCNDTQNEENNLYNNKDYSFKEKITISPTKQATNKFETINNENNKSNLELKKSFNGLQEIKVNKKKTFNHKEQLISDKIKELNEEIKKFKEETNKVTRIKEEYEKLQEKLLKDIKEFNLKKQVNPKNLKGCSQSEVKLIMSITQHNQSLILNNNKKKETIKLLKQKIFELENKIKAKNNYELTNKKNIFKKINNIDKNYFASEQFNIFTKKRNNLKKKNNHSYILKKGRINLKKKLSNSFEKIKKNKNNDIINQTMNNNSNNINKMYFENKLIAKMNNNKKIMNISCNNHNIKNSILNPKIPNTNLNSNNCVKKIDFNVNSNRNLNKKSNLNNNSNIIGINIRNNSINSGLINNINKQKNDNDVIHTNLFIYEKLINKEREKEKNYKINIKINSERDMCHKKLIKELKTETLEKNKNEKDKKIHANSYLPEYKNNYNNKKHRKSLGKTLITNRHELKTDISKNKSNLNILKVFKSKNHSRNKKNKSSIRPLNRNTTNAKNSKSIRENIKKHIKELNNSLDNKNISKEIIINTNNDNTDFEDDNENDTENNYDFLIPEKYKINNDEIIINKIESDGKKINIYSNNKKEIIFKSGVRKEIYPDGYQLVHFPNGDMKQKFVGKDEKIIYYYSETNTVQTTLKNGLNIFKFSNGQIEKHYSDGSKFIIYTNGIKRRISKCGKEKVILPEGKKLGDNMNNNEIELDYEKNNNNINKNKEEDIISKKNNDIIENNLLLSFLDIEKE